MISSCLTKFRPAILAVVALLAIIGAVVALPDSAEAGRKPMYITSVDMTITPTEASHRDFKQVDIAFTWEAPRRATAYRIKHRERINVADSPVGEAEWSEFHFDDTITSQNTDTITYEGYDFTQSGTQLQWQLRLKNKNGNWGRWRNVNVSWGIRDQYQNHFLIKREWFKRN